MAEILMLRSTKDMTEKLSMQKRFIKKLSVLLITALLLTSVQDAAYAKNDNNKSDTTRRVMVQYKRNTKNTDTRIKKINKNYKKVRDKELYIVGLDNTKLNALYNDSSIQYIEEDARIEKLDDHVTWNIKAINADKVHKSNIFGEGIKVAVFDTGIDLDNDDLVVAGGVSFVDGVESYDDDNGHGTAMAGILASSLNNQGLAGIAPNIRLYSVKVLDKNGKGYYSSIVKGIDWAIENNMDIIAMSFGGTEYSAILHESIRTATYNNILMIAASGNDGSDMIQYPANYSDVVCVGATDKKNKVAKFTNTGEQMDMFAPGVDIETIRLEGGTIKISGTSASAAHVAGTAALIWSADRNLNVEQLKAVMYKNADYDEDKYAAGWGMADAYEAFENISTTNYILPVSPQEYHEHGDEDGEVEIAYGGSVG